MTFEEIGGRSGGLSAKSVQCTIKVLQRSSGNVQLSLDLHHGPDGTLTGLHSNVIPLTLAGAPPSLMMGDVAASPYINEWLHPEVLIDDNGSGVEEWADIEVYEMRKPF